ncbi:MAG: hypothetical protein K6U80_06565 [Firmicutes bacterium]|nr:hypothetical protein [Bacillota bacterium]
MIEIDDAGGGCFLGPEVLVIHRLETNLVWYYYIPPQVRRRVSYATNILKKALVELAIPKDEPVKLCRGEIFDPFQLYLQKENYSVIREKVSEATDSLAESKFMEILYSYGFPRWITLEKRNYQDLYNLVGCWYFSQPRKAVEKLRKIRLQPPFWTKKFARQYPNLVRLLLKEEEVAAG